MAQPSISIVTPCNRVIPWFNAHLINVCSSSYTDWEWIILDNSPDGCVMQYVNAFFDRMQGKFYPECRERIKCYHEPMQGVKLEDGRLGILRNRCLELCNCGDDGFVLTLDSDDFIYPEILSIIHDISLKYPSCEVISGMCNQSLCQFIDTGVFTHQSDGMRVWNDNNHKDELFVLRGAGFRGVGFDDYSFDCINDGLRTFYVKEYHSKLSIPHVGIEFKFDNATMLNENGYPFITGFGHPIVYKKGAFLKKIGGYVDECSVEDSVTRLMPSILDDVVYINKPVYVQVTLLNTSDLTRNSTVVDANEVFNEKIGNRITVEQLLKVYDKLGDCQKFVKPIMYDC